MAKDPELLAHQQWLGYLQPVGLVVSPPALLQGQAHVNANVAAEHARFLEHVVEKPVVGRDEPLVIVKNLRALLLDVFGWQAGDLVEAGDPRAAGLEVVLPEYHETLRPTYAVPEDAKANPPSWLLLIQELPHGTDLDRDAGADERRWQATPHARFERLLRETQVPIGLLSNGSLLRLVYAPRGEAAGHVTFPVGPMTEVAGRPIFSALLMLLSAERLFSLPDKQRLPSLLAESRKYQNTVSTELAQQVLAALFELLRGFQSADDQRKGELLRDVLAHEPDQVYAGLVTVLMRLVFLLYAEDRGLLSSDEVYVRHYSVTGLFERLREDAGRYPDTMDQRYGAWAQLIALFRLVHDGGGHGTFRLPARRGYLFDPDRYAFLEGRPRGHQREPGERITPPLVADGVLYRVLSNLLVLNGDRLSYAHLDVEHVGSVYESIMGYRLEKATGRSIALKPKKTHGAPVTIDLDALLAVKPAERAKWLKEHADQSVEGKASAALKAAQTVEALAAALERKVARALTPNVVPPGGMVLQPSDERRRSGSHYTPRSLTGPIVRKALEPILAQLGDDPTPEQILGLKVCDPAMGSGAFLVEACRQLGDALLKAWVAHGKLPKIPDDETPELFAQRTVAQRCLYGVDKNPMAVDLAKLSLWLTTLAKDHPFTFLDHALKCGDSLVGLTTEQIRHFHWKPQATGQNQMRIEQEWLTGRMQAVMKYRQDILDADDFVSPLQKAQKLALADERLNLIRFVGNLAVAAFFAEDNDRKRQTHRDETLSLVSEYLRTASLNLRPTKEEATLREGSHPVTPFHWEIEFPEVFGRNAPGFDVVVGNPPFAGKNTIGEGNRDGYLDWLKAIHDESHGNSDLVAHFFRRAFNVLRPRGTFGLLATNTIAQGDTRSTGLRWICTNGGTIYAARRRYKWPGQAAVVVSVVHVTKGAGPFDLDGRAAERITAYLFHAGGNDDPAQLVANAAKSFQGSIPLGMGFTFDDTAKDDVANPISLMRELITKDNRNAERIFPFIGWEEVANSPKQEHHRYVIYFGELAENEARKWPDLMSIVEEKVRPERIKQQDPRAKKLWWQFLRPRLEMQNAIRGLSRVLVTSSQAMTQYAFGQLPCNMIYSSNLNVFPFETYSAFTVAQCRVHEVWARFMGSTLKDDLSYTPTDCFETFPFPESFDSNSPLEVAGKAYYDFRAALMVRNDEGLTKTYNRFHDPNETSDDFVKLRELHAAMDRAVLDAYGGDLAKLTVPPCEFLLDYEDEEDEDQPTTE